MFSTAAYILIAILLSAVCAGALIPIIIAFCRKYGYYDQPQQRKVHHVAVPRLGGLAFMPSAAVSVVVTMLLIYEQTQLIPDFTFSAIFMILGAVVIYIIGLLDDILDLPASTKFLVLMSCAMLMPLCNLTITNLHGLFGIEDISVWVGFPLTVLVIMTIVNALNLIDGIDGLAAGIAIICLTAYIMFFKEMSYILFMIIAAAMTGTVGAFFLFNIFGKEHGLKIFMGDTGSLTIGYALAYLAIKMILVSEQDLFFFGNPILIPYSLFIVPVFDLVRVFFTRLASGESVFKADKHHIHHILMSCGLSMHGTLAIILLLVLSYIVMNVYLDDAGLSLTMIFYIDVAVYIGFFAVLNLSQLLHKKHK